MANSCTWPTSHDWRPIPDKPYSRCEACGALSAVDLECGCRQYPDHAFPDRLCQYHEGFDDGREDINRRVAEAVAAERARCVAICDEQADFVLSQHSRSASATVISILRRIREGK